MDINILYIIVASIISSTSAARTQSDTTCVSSCTTSEDTCRSTCSPMTPFYRIFCFHHCSRVLTNCLNSCGESGDRIHQLPLAMPSPSTWSDTDISYTCGQEANVRFRIMAGTGANNCQFPWMVAIYNQQDKTVCGGTIIDNKHILTASHCFIDTDPRSGKARKAVARDLIVFSGSSYMPFNGDTATRLKRRSVSAIITHEHFNHVTLENDIAILKLSITMTFDACHSHVCLVDERTAPQRPTNCKTMGWGLTSNHLDASIQTQLRYVDLPMVSESVCQSVFGPLSSHKTFCAGKNGRDACQDDSGGPFACKEADGKYYLYGIVSAGIEHNCGNIPGLYTKVSAFLPWIQTKTLIRITNSI